MLENMKIGQNKVVEFSYDLEVEGQIVDQTTKERPLDYIHGTNSILPKLEEHIEGMQAGDRFDVTLAPADAYGEYDPEKIIELPMTAFMIDGVLQSQHLFPGNVLQMFNRQGGIVMARVVEVKDECVVMDLNSQMAGKTLHFTGEIVSVREATEKELTEGLHGEYVHSCGCGGCHGGGCSGCGDGECGEEGECGCGGCH